MAGTPKNGIDNHFKWLKQKLYAIFWGSGYTIAFCLLLPGCVVRCFFCFCLFVLMLPLRAGDLSAQDKAALAALADVLEDPARREVLVGELRRLSVHGVPEGAGVAPSVGAAAGDAKTDDAQAAKEEKKEEAPAEAEAIKAVTENAKAAVSTVISVPGRLVESGKRVASDVGSSIGQSWRALKGVFSGQDVMLRNLDWERLQRRFAQLGAVVLCAWLLYQGGSLLARGVRVRLQHWALSGSRFSPLVRRVVAALSVAALEAALLMVTIFVCASLSVYWFGEGSSQSLTGMQITVFLQAFMVLELLKTAMRVLFNPRFPGLRLLPATTLTARYWYRWFVTMINLLGYGYLVVLPLVSANLSWSLGRVFSVFLAFAAFGYALHMLWKKRREVQEALQVQGRQAQSALLAMTLKVLAWSWHWLALAYFVMLLVVTVLRADKALPYVMSGTLNTLLVVGGGLLLLSVIGHYVNHRFRFSAEWRRRVPGLDGRLNVLMPNVLRVLRMVVFWAMVVGVLAAWGVVDIRAWLASAAGHAFLDKWGGVLLIVVITALFWLAFNSVIEHRLTSGNRPSARAQTLLSLFRSALTVVVFAVAVMMVLSEIGINIGPLIAGAGVLGLAIGFGAQKLVQDIITGIFFQIENAMNKGDVVTVDGITGTAEHISIRSVGVRDSSGTYHLIPFSNVNRVSNYMRGYANHIAEYGIAYHESIDDAIVALREAFDELMKGEMKRFILEPLNVHGVTQLADSAVMIRVSIKTTPGDQWLVGRAYNRLVKLHFDAAGIEIPYPHMQVYFGQNKDGSAPPVHVLMEKGRKPVSQSPDDKEDFKPDVEAQVDTHGAARFPE